MKIYVTRPDNPGLMQALIPAASVTDLMPATGKRVPPELKSQLTAVHEAAHAVMATVLRGSDCEWVTVNPEGPGARTPTVKGKILDGNEDIIDLAGLFAELRFVEGEFGYAHQHLKNATHDLEKARARLAADFPEIEEVEWAREIQPIVHEAVAHFWPAIIAIAKALAEVGELHRPQIEAIVREAGVRERCPIALRERLKDDATALLR